MLLIADSGSTKTDWRLMKVGEEVLSFSTIGFNPYFITGAVILYELDHSKLTEIKHEITQVYFYGAGCSSTENKQLIKNVLADFFDKANVEVNHDMLAAARATCGIEEGLVAILGTGSNSCSYDGKEITENITALGYVLGDYGSGADIGKTFIKAYLEKELPIEIQSIFKKQYNLSVSDILDDVYKKELPNRFLATFSRFVYEQITHSYLRELVKKRLVLFFEKNICKYDNYQHQQLHLVGSVAFVYQNLIKEVATLYGIEIGKTIKQPINELVNYHLNN